MIIREWRGRAATDQAEAYPAHFRYKVLPELRRLSGFLGAHLAWHRLDDRVEFVVLTRWASLRAIRAFAGDDIERAVVDPGAAAALIDFDAEVRHYEVLEDEDAPLPI